MSRQIGTCAQLGHIWNIKQDASVGCARCYRCLSVQEMLSAYLRQNPKDSGPLWMRGAKP